MANIIIKETNVNPTDTGVLVTEVVYVPGFALQGPEGPTLVNSLYEFNSLYGTQSPIYTEDISYPEVNYIVTYTEVSDVEGKNPKAEGWYETDDSGEYVLTEDTTPQSGKLYYTKSEEMDTTSKGFKKTAIPDAQSLSHSMFKANSVEVGFTTARQLLSAGYRIIFDAYILESESQVTQACVEALYDKLYETFSPDTFNPMLSKGDYNYKYIFTGGYPVFEYVDGTVTGRGDLTTYLAQFCATRGDCFVLVDHTNYPDRPLLGEDSVYEAINKSNYLTTVQSSYAAICSNWYKDDYTNLMVPGSYGYLLANAEQVIQTNNWGAIAGTTRGIVPGYHPYSLNELSTGNSLTSIIPNNIADIFQNEKQKKHINAITNVNPYGYCLWGNSTLLNDARTTDAETPDAFMFLSIRSLVCDIKKQLYMACKSLLFEQNTDVLWADFQSLVTPMLNKMKSSSAIEAYQFIRYLHDPETGTEIPSNKVLAKLVIKPILPVDTFEITLEVSQTSVNINE